MSAPKTTRCAVYTRKSTEHNLDLEFNSLDAQREACEAYIKSQMHEGWRLIPDHYDDGGISGASLERPDLQRLLDDIRAGKVDTVVVYKVDRLTRSLTDFAKLVELFDDHGVSFVSVTQAFNTTSSMGRLTLNVLLSFAQFEREVIGERVRDKVAASKRKGLFMGGNIPLGYINQDKKLVVVPEEAERVQWIFQKYLKLGSLGLVLEAMNKVGIRTKAQVLPSGLQRGANPFGKGALAYLLKNRCYVGEILHRGVVHVGEHKPIVDRQIFDAVQTRLASNRVEKTLRLRGSPYLLTGLIFDSAGNRMTPSHTCKKGVRYRYYVSRAPEEGGHRVAGVVARVPAPDLEALVGEFVAGRAGTPGIQPGREILETHICKVTVQAQAVEVALCLPQAAGSQDSCPSRPPEIVSLPWARKPFVARKGVTSAPSDTGPAASKARDAALAAIGKARFWVEEILAGGTFAGIAKREGKGERQVRLLVPLAFMSPATVQGLIDGAVMPVTVTEMAKGVPLFWDGLGASG